MELLKSVLVFLTVTISLTSASEIKKRGIYNYGFAGLYSSDLHTGLHPELAHQHHHGLHSSGFNGFHGHKELINPIYARPLTVHKLGGVPYKIIRPQAGSPLGGHVTSYSVNYPRIPFHQHKHSFFPVGHHQHPVNVPIHTQFFQPQQPLGTHQHPVNVPIHTPFFLPQQPIDSHIHSIPASVRPIIQQIIPNFVQQRPSSVLPLPVKPISNPSGVLPQPTFFLPQRPVVPVAVPSNKPVFSEVFPANFLQHFHTSVHPQFIPVAVPSQPTPTVQTTQTTPTTSVSQNPTFVSIPLPIPGTNFNNGLQPEQNPWRPMSGVNIGINSIQRPAISLLPPYTAGSNQNGLQFFSPNQFHYQNSLENQNGNNNFFNSNSESKNNNNNNNFNNIQTSQAENGNNFFNPSSLNNQNTGNIEGQQQHHFTTGGDHDLGQGIVFFLFQSDK